jgi:hypothetical protein
MTNEKSRCILYEVDSLIYLNCQGPLFYTMLPFQSFFDKLINYFKIKKAAFKMYLYVLLVTVIVEIA